MAYALQWVRSLVFNIQIYIAMVVLAIAFLPFALFSREMAKKACITYCHWVMFSARWLIGLRCDVRGRPPAGEVLIAAKHQSFLDILMITSVCDSPRFIMKAILRFAPILGWYAWRIGCVPVDRGKKGKAIEQMVHGVKNNPAGPGQLIIYPQGTRVAPGVARPYKIGPAALYKNLGQTCVPVATNVGVFWPRRGVYRKPGVAVVEFLDPIAPGLAQQDFMELLEQRIEARSDELMADAGFEVRKS